MGGYLSYYCEADDFINPSEIEFTLKPDGPLVDGSVGQTIVAKATDFPSRISGLYMNSGLRDIPVGRYQVSARHIPVNGSPKVLKIKQRGHTSFQSSLPLIMEKASNSLSGPFSEDNLAIHTIRGSRMPGYNRTSLIAFGIMRTLSLSLKMRLLYSAA
ncbi:MAG: hypothetical protein EOO04_40040 [Chitinophagaceae bacterium]|nr:MAG: hypothetical protein EOO04_40040 [Chitinophagaceae bacterium]